MSCFVRVMLRYDTNGRQGAKVKLPLQRGREGKILGRVRRAGDSDDSNQEEGDAGDEGLVVRAADVAESAGFRALFSAEEDGALSAAAPFAGQVCDIYRRWWCLRIWSLGCFVTDVTCAASAQATACVHMYVDVDMANENFRNMFTAHPRRPLSPPLTAAVHANSSHQRRVNLLYRDSQLKVSVETPDLEPVGVDSHPPAATFVEPYRGRPQLKGMRVRSKPAGAGSGRWRLKGV